MILITAPAILSLGSIHYLTGRGFFPFSVSGVLAALRTYGGVLLGNLLLTGSVFIVLGVVGAALYALLVRDEGDIHNWLCGAFLLGTTYAIALLLILGLLHIYHGAVLWAVTIGVLLLLRRQIATFFRLVWTAARQRHSDRTGALSRVLLFTALLHGGGTLLVLQLVSPVPPFMDVLEVNAAPVQRIVTFARFDPLDNSPSARFAPNRNSPAHAGVFAYLTATTGKTAVRTIVGFMLPGFLAMGLGVYILGRKLGPPLAAGAATWLFLLSFNYLHSQDVRSTVFAFLYVLCAQIFYWTATSSPTRGLIYAILSGLAAGLSISTHVLVGATAYAAFLILFVINIIMGRSSSAHRALEVVAVALLPASMWVYPTLQSFALPLPIIVACLVLMAGLAVAIPVVAERRLAGDRGGRYLLTAVLASVVCLVLSLIPLRFSWIRGSYLLNLVKAYPSVTLLSICALAILLVTLARTGNQGRHADTVEHATGERLLLYTLAVFAAPAAMLAMINVFPDHASFRDIAQELYWKTEFYWGSMLLVFPAAMVFAVLYDTGRGRHAAVLRWSSLALLVVLVTLPLHSLTNVTADNYVEHKLAETQSIHLAVAEHGYWRGCPDRRYLIDPIQERFIAHLLSLVRSGEIGFSDKIIHLTAGPDHWESTPFPVFTGIGQILITAEAPRGIYPFGSRTYYYREYFAARPTPSWILVERRSMFEGIPFASYDQVFVDDYHALWQRKR